MSHMDSRVTTHDRFEDRPAPPDTEGFGRPGDEDRGSRCLAVMYHYVHDRECMVSHGVGGLTTREFGRQLDRLSHAMEPTDWPSIYAWMQGRGNLPERCFLLTFDDGLVDHTRVVLPILRERGLRGVFFVPGSILTGERMLSAHAIHVLLSTLGEERFHRELRAYLEDHVADAGEPESPPTSRDDHSCRCENPFSHQSFDPDAAERMYHYESPARAHLKYLLTIALPIDLRQAAVKALFERHVGSMSRWARSWYLGWDDVVRMETLGHTIGGHGHLHEPYRRLSSAHRRRDVHRVATILRAGLGVDIRPFSYPYGDFDDTTVSACHEAGFAHAFTTRSGWITRGSDTLRLPRVDTIDVDTVLEREFACTPV